MTTNFTPFDQGTLAHAEGEYAGANPYPSESKDYKEWLEGWRQADEDDPLPWDDGLEDENEKDEDGFDDD